MEKRTILALIGLFVLIGTFPYLKQNRRKFEPTNVSVDAPSSLLEHTNEFVKKEIIQVCSGVYMAIGYGLANSMMIVAEDGRIIIDVLESVEAARIVKAEFDKISEKPVLALIYTHFHPDHILGAKAFVENQTHPYEIYANEMTATLMHEMGTTQEITFIRGMRQFGALLTHDTGHINSGIGYKLNFGPKHTVSMFLPTKMFNTPKTKIKISNIELELYHAPGETDDQIIVWFPQKSVLFAADDIYRTFPNIYAIRGTPTRDPNKWIRSLDVMIELQPEILIPSHTRFIAGRSDVIKTLMAYRDGIQFVLFQTIKLMNLGLSSDEIIEEGVTLPPSLSDHPFLQQFYGTIDWTVRGIFGRYLGWFNGKSQHLFPESSYVQAKRLIELGGGQHKLYAKTIAAMEKGNKNDRWCLEVISSLLLHPGDLDVGSLKRTQISLLRSLASTQTSANGRNYYLTLVAEEEGLTILPSKHNLINTIVTAPLMSLFESMSIYLDPVKAEFVDTVVGFHFPDVNEKLSVHIRNCVSIVKQYWPDDRNLDMRVIVPSTVWRNIVSMQVTPIAAIFRGDLRIETETPFSFLSGPLLLSKFFGLYNVPKPKFE